MKNIILNHMKINYMSIIIRTLIKICANKLIYLLSICLFIGNAYSSERIDFNDNWKFCLGDDSIYKNYNYDDSKWRVLNLPHDWSIEGDFDQNNPASPGGGALPGGIGWYRKHFILNEKEKDKLFFIDFDGVYRNSEVWINGYYLGIRPYGYISFRYELTPFLKFNGKENIIVVKVDNSKQPNSRWYSGSGIYRNVWLVKSEKLYFNHWGTSVITRDVTDKSAKIVVNSEIKNNTGGNIQFEFISELIDGNGKAISHHSSKNNIIKGSINTYLNELSVNDPKLWSLENPYLYTLHNKILVNNKIIDEEKIPIGIRYFEFDSNNGFSLNGKFVKINGVCNHHDLGCLGAAINKRAIERQLEIMKGMGVNALRTSHNPPAPELLDLCDKMGILVMDEAFDMWRKKKTEFDYSLDFDNWHKKDLEDFVRRDRNHPSVIIWSIGNEILEQWDSTGIAIAKSLSSIVRNIDSTRPITSACNDPYPWNNIIKSDALDLIGYNYHQQDFTKFFEYFPGKKFIATETVSGLATRGHYDMPSNKIRRWPYRWDEPFKDGNPDFTCSSYDNCSAPWGSTHIETWSIIKKHKYLSGQFIWTGFDYLGEPTPYWWPARSSYFGIVDLCGFPKDVYYLYQSEWTDKDVLHIFPHWNWKKGDTIDIVAYTNCDEVELFVNNKSFGKKVKTDTIFSLTWKVPFEEGSVKAIGKRNGKELIKEIKTAGYPKEILLIPDRKEITADKYDLCFIEVDITDGAKTIVPYADNLVVFDIEGEGNIVGVDNGCQTSHERFKDNKRKAFNGKCLVVIQSNGKKGMIKLKAKSEGLKGSEIIINAK